MNAAELRMRLILASVVLKMAEPYLKKYGVDVTLDDVLDAFMLVGSAWHFAVPYLQRYLPVPAKGASTDTPFLNPASHPTAPENPAKVIAP